MHKFESLIYFSYYRLNQHIQDEALYNKRMLEATLLLVCSLHWFGNFSQIFQYKFNFSFRYISAYNTCWNRFVSERFCHFPWKSNFLSLIQIWIKLNMYINLDMLLNLSLIHQLKFQHCEWWKIIHHQLLTV